MDGTASAITVITAGVFAGVAVFALLLCALWDTSAIRRTRKKHKASRTLLGVVTPPTKEDNETTDL